MVFTVTFYFYLEKQNKVTALRLELPKEKDSLTRLKGDVKELQYIADQLESPSRLMEIAASSQFSHLKYPFLKDILNVEEGLALQEKPLPLDVLNNVMQKPSLSIANATK